MREDFEKQRQKYRDKDQKRRESLRKETNANYETVNEKIEESKIDKDREVEIMAVSYTHLDVYKRQQLR